MDLRLQSNEAAFSPKTLRAAGLLTVAGVGSFLTARFGDARNSPPWPPPKSFAAGPLRIFKQALSAREAGAGLESSKSFSWVGHSLSMGW